MSLAALNLSLDHIVEHLTACSRSGTPPIRRRQVKEMTSGPSMEANKTSPKIDAFPRGTPCPTACQGDAVSDKVDESGQVYVELNCSTSH